MAVPLPPALRMAPAFAKLNLALDVAGRRPDGYHDLESVMVVLDWHDLVAAAPSSEPGVRIRVVDERAGDRTGAVVPATTENLACRAAQLLQDELGTGGVTLTLYKRLPVAAGLGGGSSDAATALRLLAPPGLGPARLQGLAARLGSDVPFLVGGGAALVTGRGEHLEPLPPPTLHVMVAVAGAGLTGAAYAALEPQERESSGRARALAVALVSGLPPPPLTLGSALEAAAGRADPHLATRLATLRAALADTTLHLTGSGGAAFAITPSAAAARDLAERARSAGFPARASRTVTTALY